MSVNQCEERQAQLPQIGQPRPRDFGDHAAAQSGLFGGKMVRKARIGKCGSKSNGAYVHLLEVDLFGTYASTCVPVRPNSIFTTSFLLQPPAHKE